MGGSSSTHNIEEMTNVKNTPKHIYQVPFGVLLSEKYSLHGVSKK